MSVYVDQPRLAVWACLGRRATAVCHLMADTDAELEAMAARLRLRKAWRHNDHYDLTANKRRLAIAAGAVEVSSMDLVRLRQSKREASQ